MSSASKLRTSRSWSSFSRMAPKACSANRLDGFRPTCSAARMAGGWSSTRSGEAAGISRRFARIPRWARTLRASLRWRSSRRLNVMCLSSSTHDPDRRQPQSEGCQAMPDTNDGATKIWVLALTSAGSLMAVLDAMVVATALNTMRTELPASIEALEWTMNAYNLSFAVLLLTGAALGDRFGRRRVFIAGLVLFVAASAACALAGSVGWLIGARAAQGAGAALIMPIAMALLSATFPPQERAKALGIFSGVTGLALIAGPIVGGAIAQGAAWQWIFWINIPIGLIVIPLAYRRVPESFGPGTAVDGAGVVLATGAALGLVFRF